MADKFFSSRRLLPGMYIEPFKILKDLSRKKIFLLYIFTAFIISSEAQFRNTAYADSRADSLRGSITRERAWWDVMRYDITFQPDYNNKSIKGKTDIIYKVIDDGITFMQIDLQKPMLIDSIILNGFIKLNVAKRDENLFYVIMPKQIKNKKYKLTVYFGGKPKEAVRPPWQGGFIWEKDSLGRPWISVACQGLGASAWFPCKDHQSDKPDEGASLTMIVPDTLSAVANGRLVEKKTLNNNLASYKWEVKNPINSYNIIPSIGKYIAQKHVYRGEKGNLDVTLWSLDYNVARMRSHALPDVMRTLASFEKWFGPYPFYEDGYQLIESPHLGMEHQSAIAYGNNYLNGYRGNDISNSSSGLKFDFIIVHESGHEWFGNSITASDIADMWIHESFTNYSEVLFVEDHFGAAAAAEYVYGIRGNILNDKPIIGQYGMNRAGSGDMYYKGANMVNNIRLGINNDARFRELLRSLNKDFYHKAVSNRQVQQYINKFTGINFDKTFEQYLTTTQIPVFEYYFSPDKKEVFYRYGNCVKDFDMPLVLANDSQSISLKPLTTWQTYRLKGAAEKNFFENDSIEKRYYLTAKQVED